jgi:signal transduction histidine kinase
MNYAQLIADTAAPESRAVEYAGEILAETARVAIIVRNLLQFARQETQTHSPARLADIVEQTLSLLRAVLRRDQITLTVDMPDGLPLLKCRSQQIQQVLMNLLTNARDALNAKYPGYHPDKTITMTCRPFDQGGRRWLRVTVADRGTGIPPEIQARIFDPFFTTKPRDKGTGLGLSISHGIAKDHHGALHFETAPGIRTQFHLDLPVDNGWRVEEE